MQHSKSKDFPIGKKMFARYTDDHNDIQINFIPVYVVEDEKSLYIGTKNNMIGTPKGYFTLESLTGSIQINAKFLSNIYLKK